MKFLTFVVFDAAKAAEVAQAGDKSADTPGAKLLAQYLCQGIPFPHTIPPDSMVVVGISEVETNEAMSAINYPLALTGATVWNVPALEMPVGGAAATEKKYRA